MAYSIDCDYSYYANTYTILWIILALPYIRIEDVILAHMLPDQTHGIRSTALISGTDRANETG